VYVDGIGLIQCFEMDGVSTYEEHNTIMREMMAMPDAMRNRFMVDLRIWNDTVDIITIGDEQALIMLN